MLEQQLRNLIDEHELRNLVYRLSISMDERDYEGFRSCWCDQVDLDIPSMAEGEDQVGQGSVDADIYSRQVIEMLSGFEATQHVSTNHLFDVEGDTAHCVSYVFGTHFLRSDNGEAIHQVGAKYEFSTKRVEGVWKIDRMKWRKFWGSGNAGLWNDAARIVEERLKQN